MSGRRKHPTPPASEPLTALTGRLTDSDTRVCRLLAEHQVLTTGLLTLLLDLPTRTLQQRLATLTALKVVDRFRPHRPVGAGSAPYHYLLGETGAAILAADPTSTVDRGLGWDRARLLGLAQANGRLAHLLGSTPCWPSSPTPPSRSPGRGWCAGGRLTAATPTGAG